MNTKTTQAWQKAFQTLEPKLTKFGFQRIEQQLRTSGLVTDFTTNPDKPTALGWEPHFEAGNHPNYPGIKLTGYRRSEGAHHYWYFDLTRCAGPLAGHPRATTRLEINFSERDLKHLEQYCQRLGMASMLLTADLTKPHATKPL